MADHEQRGDRFTEVEDRYTGYQVYDHHYEKIGKVDDLFVDETDSPEYVGVKMGFLGTRTTLIPMDLIRVNDERELMEVASDKDHVQEGPTFDNDDEITSDFEREIRDYYGLESHGTSTERGSYGSYYRDEDYETGAAAGGRYERDRVDLEPGERSGERSEEVYDYEERRDTGDVARRATPEYTEREREASYEPTASRDHEEDTRGRGRDLEDENELRVQRSEEELRAGTRERRAGSVNVRKRVRTDRERLRVPKRHEEVSVDRVSVNERTASEGEIGEDEIRMPVVEEEVIVEKRPVVKEELRIRKNVVEEEEIIEADVRKEEIEIDDETDRRSR